VAHDPVLWLYGLQSHGIKLGLEGIRTLLRLVDHPERAYPSVLVGGTNGKGSVAAMLDAMLAASGATGAPEHFAIAAQATNSRLEALGLFRDILISEGRLQEETQERFAEQG